MVCLMREGVAAPSFAYDNTYVISSSARGCRSHLTIENELLEDLGSVCKDTGVTLFTVAMSAWMGCLIDADGEGSEISVNLPITYRDLEEAIPMIGDFVKMITLTAPASK